MSPEPRVGLGGGKVRRPHPASPKAMSDRSAPDTTPRASRATPASDAELVMLCVRIPPSLRRRLKLVSVQSGRPLQALATDALEQVCTQFDM
jgi:hypothetical protein